MAEIPETVTLEQVTDMVKAIAAIDGDAKYLKTILRTALDGLRPTTDVEPAWDLSRGADPFPVTERSMR